MSLEKIPRWSWFVIVLLLIGAIVWQGNELRIDRRDTERRHAAVSIAKAQVIDLTTLDSDTVSAKIKAMSARTSGSFKSELAGISNTFVKIVQDKKVKATGIVDAAAITSASATSATVLVASTAAIVQGIGKPSMRTYRIRVKLTWSKNTWQINGMEFVQ